MEKKQKMSSVCKQRDVVAEELDSLIICLKNLCTMLLRRFNESEAYITHKEYLADLSMLPEVYILQEYPMTSYIIRRDKLICDYESDNISFEEWDYLSVRLSASYSTDNNHLQDYRISLEDFTNKLLANNELTSIVINEFLTNYAEAKRLDLRIIDTIVDNWDKEYQDIEWLGMVKENCLKGTKSDDDNSLLMMPAYFQYRQAWVFDYIRCFYVERTYEGLDKAQDLVFKMSNKCVVKPFNDNRLSVNIDDIILCFTIDEKGKLVTKMDVKVKNENHNIAACVLEIRKKSCLCKTGEKPKIRWSFPDIDSGKEFRFSEVFSGFLFCLLVELRSIQTSCRVPTLIPNPPHEDINTIIRKILPFEGAKSFTWLSCKKSGDSSYHADATLKIEVKNKSGKAY